MIRKLLDDLESLKGHIRELWYFTKTRQFGINWHKEGARLWGWYYDWYDGPHYAFGFGLFNLYWYGFKDYDRGMARYRLINMLGKLLYKKFH